MAQTLSTMLELGTVAPHFHLPDITGKLVNRDDFKSASALLVMFVCNHCPFVKHIQAGLVQLAKDYQPKGIAIVAINSNDTEKYPDDSPAKMQDEARAAGYTFPYLFDATQSVAKAYRAACTPDFFLFDKNFKLVYRGQFDGARPKNAEPVTGKDMRAAFDALLASRMPSTNQVPSVGCNIKWKPDNEPDYFSVVKK